MRTPVSPRLQPGRVYRTADLRRWDRNGTRLARRLEEEGRLDRLAQGLYACPGRSGFGPVPPSDEAVLRSFLKGSPWVIGGPPAWNRLGLGATAAFADGLAYTPRRTTVLRIGNRRIRLRRVRFPRKPTAEWWVIDLFRNHAAAGLDPGEAAEALGIAVGAGRFDREALRSAARTYGTRRIRSLVEDALAAAPSP
jgi:hypothetical protein